MNSAHDVTIELAIVDLEDKGLDNAPSMISIGALRLRGWQVHPVATSPSEFDGSDAYLVRVNYELTVVPDMPAMNWFELGVDVAAGAVLDAVPHAAVTPQPAGSYVLNDYFNLVPPVNELSMAYVPPTFDVIDRFGVGGNGIRWRHEGVDGRAVRPGSRVAWLVMLVENGAAGAEITVSARFDLRPEAGGDVLADCGSATLELTLPAADVPEMEPLSGVGNDGARPLQRRPEVFISYAHENARHKRLVRGFANLLLQCGLQVRLDQFEAPPRKDWHIWATRLIDGVDFVIVIASPNCLAVGEGRADKNANRGLHSEMATIRERLHQDRARWEKKLLPVVLPGESIDNIPVFLQPRTMDHYEVPELTGDAVSGLVAAMEVTLAEARQSLLMTAES